MTETLRERTRARRRTAVARAALELFAEQGYEQTTIAQVAERAEVAPRTVALYFASKLDLALSYHSAAAERYRDALARRRPEQSTLDVLAGWAEREVGEHGETLALQRRLRQANPALRAAETREIAEARAVARAALADDLGRAPDDVVVALVASAFDGVVATLFDLDPQKAEVHAIVEAVRTLLDSLVGAARSMPFRSSRRPRTTSRRRATGT